MKPSRWGQISLTNSLTRDRRCERGASDVGEVSAHHHPQRVGLKGDLRGSAATDLAVDVEVQGRIGV
jgi:hypothetical protein